MAYREVPSYGIYCLTYEFLSAKMHHHEFTDSHGIVADLVSGGVAGSLTWFSIIPFDVIKSRFQADFTGEYEGFLHCAKELYREGGVRIFYTGCLVTCLRAFPVNAVTFLVYSQTLKYLEMKWWSQSKRHVFQFHVWTIFKKTNMNDSVVKLEFKGMDAMPKEVTVKTLFASLWGYSQIFSS